MTHTETKILGDRLKLIALEAEDLLLTGKGDGDKVRGLIDRISAIAEVLGALPTRRLSLYREMDLPILDFLALTCPWRNSTPMTRLTRRNELLHP